MEKNLSSQGLIVPGHPSPQSKRGLILIRSLGHTLPLTSPLVVQHPAVSVHLGGAPGLARVAVRVSAGVVSDIAIEEGEDTRHPTAAHRPAGLWGQMTLLSHCSLVTAGLTARLQALQAGRTFAQDV